MECGGLLFLCVNRNIFISGSINSDGTNAYNKNGGNSSKNATTARTGRGGNGAINLIKI